MYVAWQTHDQKQQQNQTKQKRRNGSGHCCNPALDITMPKRREAREMKDTMRRKHPTASVLCAQKALCKQNRTTEKRASVCAQAPHTLL